MQRVLTECGVVTGNARCGTAAAGVRGVDRRCDMSAPAFAWALERGASLSLKPAERLVLLYLADMANGERVCWPGQPTIMRFTGLKMTTVRAAVRQLAAKHLIAVEAQPGIVTRYHILRPVTPSNGHGAESVTPTKTAQGHPCCTKMALQGTPMKGDGDPCAHFGRNPVPIWPLTPPNGHTDPSYTQEVDPKRRASAPEASQVLSFPGNGTPQPEPSPLANPPTRNTTLSSVPPQAAARGRQSPRSTLGWRWAGAGRPEAFAADGGPTRHERRSCRPTRWPRRRVANTCATSGLPTCPMTCSPALRADASPLPGQAGGGVKEALSVPLDF